MRLTQAQIAEYDRNGFIVLPHLVSPAEVQALAAELERVGSVHCDEVIREKAGAVRSVFRVHDDESPTSSTAFAAFTRLPRVLEPARQLLRDDALYIYHTKCNLKEAVEGAVWQWHQDYGVWFLDGVPTPNMTTALLMLDEATEIGGCLYFIPGSHRVGRLAPAVDEETTSYKLWTVPKEQLIPIMQEYGDPVAITGKPGTVVLFHPNIVHGSGHNMSRHSRWHFYAVFNGVANRPQPTGREPRPEWVVSTKYAPLNVGSDDALIARQTAPVA